MAIKKRIKNLSKLTRELLAEGESVRSDFKRLPDGISADDLVAFANSEAGGQILAGVDEQVVDKAQIGVVRGCNVNDATVLQVLNKAVSCIPPVSIDIYIENLDDKPILRVEVPPSQTKPHCTPKGVYCRRDGARNRPLHPSELLRLFLDSEASAFAARFEVAAERITDELSNLESSLDSSIRSMSDQLGWADSQLDDTESTLARIQGLVAKLTID
ncbi:MAG: ATP-binding protein, partial [Mesorhizobium sp.]